MTAIVGREAELGALAAFLDVAEHPRALILSGGPGIGKTTLWQAGVAAARERGTRVLTARPSEIETRLSLAGLADLLEDVDDGVLAALPTPQARALEVALFRAEPVGIPPDPRAVAAAFLGLLRELGSAGPVLVAIDDVQWLDKASQDVLSFALRRLGGEPLRFLISVRTGTTSTLVSTFHRERADRIDLTGLSFPALRRLLVDRLNVSLSRSASRRLHETTEGNPLFALEIGRLLAESGVPDAAEPLPVPDDVQTLVRNRVSRLPPPTRELLLAAALLSRPDVETLRATVGAELEEALDPAERAGIVTYRRDAVTFSHPLHAAGVVALASASELRDMHRRLADTAPELEERARHRARGFDVPDEVTARLLDQGAAAARARGGLHSAAELLARARELTPADDVDGGHRRGLEAAESHLHGGDPERARVLLEELLSEPLARSRRAEALRILAEVALAEENPVEADNLLVQALSFADDVFAQARIQLVLTYVAHFSFDFVRTSECARRAVELLADSDDGPFLAEALSYCAIADYLADRGVDWKKVERALELEDPDRTALPGLGPSGVAAILRMFVGHHAAARELITATCSRLSERGEEKDLATALIWHSWLEIRCGNFGTAARIADEAIACASMTGHRIMETWATSLRALVDAHLGEVADVRRRCAEALAGQGGDLPHTRLWVMWSLAVLESSLTDYEATWEACRGFADAVEGRCIGPITPVWLPDAIEALIALGRLDRAEGFLVALEESGLRLEQVWALATAKRCRGLLRAARGDLAGALTSFEDALAEHERIDFPFERARTLLALGAVERRARRRTRARLALDEAAGEFERMGAKVWAERARGELERVGGRRPQAAGALTATEQRVSELAVSGLSNKEIARTLFVSVHTVEVHLSHAYAKLGVHSRARLARILPTGAAGLKV
jgi:DNA-binding CsgD family transcriptional regulator